MAASRTGEGTRLVYLVQHGEAEPESRDPQRPLTALGRQTVEQVSDWASPRGGTFCGPSNGWHGLKVEQIRHSGKLRARQTAAIFAERLQPRRSTVSWPGLGPNDDVRPLAEELADGPASVMIVGHLPFLARLAGLMLTGDPQRQLVRFCNGGLVGLAREDGQWVVACAVPPEMVIGQ